MTMRIRIANEDEYRHATVTEETLDLNGHWGGYSPTALKPGEAHVVHLHARKRITVVEDPDAAEVSRGTTAALCHNL